ncbi:hypothetical protein BaRGS_00032873 [Batillaria attramentaria]|uniref:Uncharacterized protein n=1 Tax=Batillaria attramentaria TaxID=370345 RepID=A0ABD0JMD7_9CAEN
MVEIVPVTQTRSDGETFNWLKATTSSTSFPATARTHINPSVSRSWMAIVHATDFHRNYQVLSKHTHVSPALCKHPNHCLNAPKLSALRFRFHVDGHIFSKHMYTSRSLSKYASHSMTVLRPPHCQELFQEQMWHCRPTTRTIFCKNVCLHLPHCPSTQAGLSAL